MTKLPKDATPAEVHAWFKAQEHRTLATAARRRAHYDVEEAGAAEYHDAEVARLEAELAAGRGRKKRKNPADHALVGFDEVMDEDEDEEDEDEDVYGDVSSTEPLRHMAETGVGSFDEYYDAEGPEDVSDLRYGRGVIWNVATGKTIEVDPAYVVARPDNIFSEDKLAAVVEAVSSGLRPILGVANAQAHIVNKADVAENQEAFERGEVLQGRPLNKSDVGKLWFTLRDGHHRAFGALIAGERKLWLELMPNQLQDVKQWRRGKRVNKEYDELMERLAKLLDEEEGEVRENPPRRRRNPTRAAYAHDAHADEVDDWVTIEECGCHACAPARMNPRAAKRAAAAAGAYADLDSVTLVIENALANYGLSMSNILAVKFTRGGKSRAGACSYSPSINKCQIMFNGLAWPAFTEEQRLNTVLHEAAHAIQFLTTGTSDHGPKWQKIARSIGCSGDSCMTLEASQAMVDAYAEAKGLEKRKIITREDAEAARSDFAVGDYVSFDHKRERWFGKIVSRGPMHATVMIQSPREGITGKIPYPSLQKEAPPRHAEKVAGVDKPAPGESLSAWQARTGRGRENPDDVRVRFDGYARSELDIQKEVEDVIGDDSFAVVLPYYADGVLTCPRGVKEDVADALNDLSNAYEEQSRLSTRWERERGESRAVLDAISKGFGTASRRLRGAP